MNLNLILAIVWFVVGVVWLVTTWARGDDALPVIRLGEVRFSPAWMAAVLCVYNVVRWWFRPRRRSQESLQATLDAHRRPHRAHDRPDLPPDPNFNFTEAPPAPESRPTDPPPSAN